MTIAGFRQQYEATTGQPLSMRQAYRWITGEIKTLPHPDAQNALQAMFGESAARLLGNPTEESNALALSVSSLESPSVDENSGGRNWEGRLIAMSTERARDFLPTAESTNVGDGTIEQLSDDLKTVADLYLRTPLPSLLGDLYRVQDQAFTLLEGKQFPQQSRALYFHAGISSTMMAKACYDSGNAHGAMTHARVAYACAKNADHPSLGGFVLGMRSLFAYWQGRYSEAASKAAEGLFEAQHSNGTVGIWLATSEARAWAALGNIEKCNEALRKADERAENARGDELDEFGGICTFSRPRRLYYEADALAWLTDVESARAEAVAQSALDAYQAAPEHERGFGDEAGAATDLAIARLHGGEIAGAIEAFKPVLLLRPEQRIHGVVASVRRVQAALVVIDPAAKERIEMQDSIENFTSAPLAALPR